MPWDHALSSTNETPTEIILEGLFKSKLQDSVQLQTVLTLYDQETIRNNGQMLPKEELECFIIIVELILTAV